MRVVVLVFVILCAASNAVKFPNGWTACKMGQNHNECVREAIQAAVPDLVKGIPRLGVMPIDPLLFKKIAIDQRDRPVSLNLIFTDLEIEGIRDVKIDSVKNDWKTMILDVTVPVMKGKGGYKADGKVLVLPIQGEGDCTLLFDDFKATITIKFDEKTVNQKAYYNLKHLDIVFDAQKLTLELKNLFNGNKQLGDQMNLFLNENWREILTELKPAIEAALKQACTDMAMRFFSKVPKREITPQ